MRVSTSSIFGGFQTRRIQAYIYVQTTPWMTIHTVQELTEETNITTIVRAHDCSEWGTAMKPAVHPGMDSININRDIRRRMQLVGYFWQYWT